MKLQGPISAFLITILMISAFWCQFITIKGYRNFQCYCGTHTNLKCRGKSLLILSIIFSLITLIISPCLYYMYLITKSKKWFAYLVSSSFVLVFTAVFINMTVIYSNYYDDFRKALGDNSILMELNLCDEWSLAVGFLCSGGYAALYCSC